MQRQTLKMAVVIAVALAVISARARVFDACDPEMSPSDAVRNEPFSAESYVRIMKMVPDGKQQFIRNGRYPIRLARSSEGRVRLDIVPNPPPECDHLAVLVPPPCPNWAVVIFDPRAQTTTRWERGERGYHGPVVVKLSASQLGDEEGSTLKLPAQPTIGSVEDPKIIFTSIGQREIDG